MLEGCAADMELSESGFLKDFSNSYFELGLEGHRGCIGGSEVEAWCGGGKMEGS